MTDLRYSECGCTVPPGASRCPHYGNKYNVPPGKAQAKSNHNGITISCVGYATKC